MIRYLNCIWKILNITNYFRSVDIKLYEKDLQCFSNQTTLGNLANDNYTASDGWNSFLKYKITVQVSENSTWNKIPHMVAYIF